MFSRLHVAMLGRFELWEEPPSGSETARRTLPKPPTAKSQSLLAYLLLHRRKACPRETLAGMFWGDRPPQRARRSLSTALWHIRHALPDKTLLHSDSRSVQIRPGAPLWVDVEAFEKLSQSASLTDLEQAAGLYGGDFLEGFFDNWVVEERRRLAARFEELLSTLITRYESLDAPEAVLTASRQLLHQDPLREEAHRAAMRAYARMGQRNAALEQYHRCREVIGRELGVAPMPETTALYEDILAGKLQPRRGLGAPARLVFPRPASETHPAAAAAETPLVGREAELALLSEHWQRAAGGRGDMLFLTGEAGIGKTRLLNVLARHARQQGGQVLMTACLPYEQGQPYGPLADLLREALSIGGEAPLRGLSSWQIASLSGLAPEMRGLLPAGATNPGNAEMEQKHLLGALTHLMVQLARRLPLLIVLDDLQWAHPSTLAWLPVLAQAGADTPLLLAAAYRTEDVAPGDLLARIVHRLETQGRARSIPLGRLSPEDLADWLPGLDAASLNRIHRHTEGNPFFIRETVNALLEGEHLQREGNRYRVGNPRFTPPLPPTVRKTIALRVDTLSPEARQGLRVAAVIGRGFDLDVWMQVWGQPEMVALTALDELLRRRLLREGQGPFAPDYEFDHHLVQETVYHACPTRWKQRLHTLTARALEKLRGGESGVSARIASHYLKAGQTEQARPWLLAAGDQAVRLSATAEALHFYQRALAGYPSDVAHRFPRAVLERKIGEVRFRRGEYEQAEQNFHRALALLGHPFPAAGWPLHRAVSAALGEQIARRLTPPAFRRTSQAVTPALREEVSAYTSLGWMYSLQARYEAYLLVSLRALNISERAGYARGVAVAAAALGIAADFMARFGVAAHFHRQARETMGAVDEPGDAGFAAFGQAYHAYLCDDEDTMLAQATLAAEKYRLAGDAHRWALNRVLQSYVFTQRGQLDGAESRALELVREGAALDDLEMRCQGALLSGLIARLRGDWTAGAAQHEQAAAFAGAIPDYMSLVENLAELARCRLRLGDWDAASRALEEAERTIAARQVKGDVVGKYALTSFEAALWAVEHLPDARRQSLARAKKARRAALRACRAFRPAEPEVWRLCGRYAWLRQQPEAARRWWEKSMKGAEERGHALDWAMTALEMGLRLGDEALQARAQARMEEAGAAGEIAFLTEEIPNRQ